MARGWPARDLGSPSAGPYIRSQWRPEWSHDGKRVLFRTARDRRADLWWRSVVAREPLFPDTYVRGPYHANYDVAPDGPRLLLLRATDQAQVMIGHNWIDEVRSRFGPSR
jgi:hypothetical protein